jgi:hypothetical protein
MISSSRVAAETSIHKPNITVLGQQLSKLPIGASVASADLLTQIFHITVLGQQLSAVLSCGVDELLIPEPDHSTIRASARPLWRRRCSGNSRPAGWHQRGRPPSSPATIVFNMFRRLVSGGEAKLRTIQRLRQLRAEHAALVYDESMERVSPSDPIAVEAISVAEDRDWPEVDDWEFGAGRVSGSVVVRRWHGDRQEPCRRGL